MSQDNRLEIEDASRRPAGRFAHWCLRADPWPLLLLALALAGGYCWTYRCPTRALVGLAYYEDFCAGFVLFGLLAAGRCAQLLVRGELATRLGTDDGVARSRRWFLPWLVLIAAGTFLVVRWELPLLVSFHLSRPALDRLANEALADPAQAQRLSGRWAGLYRIVGVEVIGKTVVLYLGDDRGSYGFARVPGASSDEIFNLPGHKRDPQNHRDFPASHGGASDPEGKRITGDWFVMYSGYWRWKVGWS
jgi:hypothetical protein